MASISVATESNPNYKSQQNLEVQNILSVKGYGVIGYENNFGRVVPLATTSTALSVTGDLVFKNRLIAGTPGGAANYTFDTAANLKASFVAIYNYLRVGDFVTFWIENLSGANTITLVAGGVTLGGTATMRNIAPDTAKGYILLCTDATTPAFTLYPISS